MVDPERFVEAVREENQTPLSRLGSSKSLYADTDGELDRKPVLEAVARAEHAAWQTFQSWADDESNDETRAFFERVAEQERIHYERVADRLDADWSPSEPTPALHEDLRARSETVDRLGAFVGRVLASKRSKDQVIGYFVGNADPQTADMFRDFGDQLDEQLTGASALLESIVTGEAEYDRALEAASDAIGAAYDEYVESLEALGANPKPVC